MRNTTIAGKAKLRSSLGKHTPTVRQLGAFRAARAKVFGGALLRRSHLLIFHSLILANPSVALDRWLSSKFDGVPLLYIGRIVVMLLEWTDCSMVQSRCEASPVNPWNFFRSWMFPVRSVLVCFEDSAA